MIPDPPPVEPAAPPVEPVAPLPAPSSPPENAETRLGSTTKATGPYMVWWIALAVIAGLMVLLVLVSMAEFLVRGEVEHTIEAMTLGTAGLLNMVLAGLGGVKAVNGRGHG